MNVEKIMKVWVIISGFLFAFCFFVSSIGVSFLIFGLMSFGLGGMLSLNAILFRMFLVFISLFSIGFLLLTPFIYFGFLIQKYPKIYIYFRIYTKIISILLLIFFIVDIFIPLINFNNLNFNNIRFDFVLFLIFVPIFYYGWLKKPTETPISDIKTIENNSDSGLNLEQK